MSTTEWSTEPRERVDQVVTDQGERLKDGFVYSILFNDQAILDAEIERIFGNCWIFVGHESEIPNPGDYAIRYIGDDPFVFVRDENHEIQLLHNTCRHQGNNVCRVEQGNTSHFRCTFHGWTYKNTGELVGVPGEESGYKNIDKSEYGLRKAPRVDSYRGMVFGSLAESGQSLEEYLGAFKWYLDLYFALGKGGMEVIAGPKRYIFPTNWKAGAETTSADSYHTGTTHQSAIQAGVEGKVDFSQAGTNPQDRHVSHAGAGSVSHRIDNPEQEEFFGLPEEYRSPENLTDEQWEVAARCNTGVSTVFPNLSLVMVKATNNPETLAPTTYLNLRQWRPLTPDKTEVWNWDLIPAAAADDAEFRERSHNASVITLGPTGLVETDDNPMFYSKTELSKGQLPRKHKHEWTYQLGTKGLSDIGIDTDWPGPGTCWDSNLEENCMRTFYWNWYKAMSGQDVGTTWEDDPLVREFYEGNGHSTTEEDQ